MTIFGHIILQNSTKLNAGLKIYIYIYIYLSRESKADNMMIRGEIYEGKQTKLKRKGKHRLKKRLLPTVSL